MERPFPLPLLAEAASPPAGPPPRGGGAIAADADGRLYVVTRDGGLASADVREYLLGDTPPSPPPPTRHLRLHPPLDFHVHHFALSPDGARAALAGPSHADPDAIAARVVDLASARPAPGGHGAADADSVPLAGPLFAARPGLRVVQVAWHPRSARHVALLTSDAVLRLYCATASAAVPEQEFDLAGVRGGGGGGGRRLGLGADADDGDGAPSRSAASFAFGGDGPLWDRFTVHVTASDGAVFGLCPVAPFGEALPARVAAAVAASAAASPDPAARAWAQRALPAATALPPSSVVRIAPHALDEHAPGLAGPLPASAPGGGDARAVSSRPGDAVASTLCLTAAPGAVALLVASRRGRLAALAVAGDAAPAFCAAPPRVAAGGGGGVAAVKLTCRRVPPPPGRRALLLDVVERLGGGEGEAGGDPAAPAHTILLADPDDPARALALRAASAYAVDVDWLPALAARLAGGGGGAGLPRARVRPLRRGPGAAPGVAPVAAAVLSAPPADGGLALLLPGGRGALARCARPAGAASAAAATLSPVAAGAAAPSPPPTASPALARVLAAAPRPAPRPPLTGDADDAATPAGAAALADAVRALTDAHVDYAHAASAAVTGAGAEARRGVADATAAATALAARAAADLARHTDALAPRLARAAALQANLQARARLLARLVWSLPRPPNEAEARLASRELPSLEAAAAAVAADVAGLARRATALNLEAAAGRGGKQRATVAAAALPPAQLARARAAAADAAGLTAAAAKRLAALEAAVADAEEEAVVGGGV